MLEFDDVVAPLTREQFLANYWTKSFLAAKGVAGRFAGLLGWDELNAILEQHRLAPPRFRLTYEGRTLEPFGYMSPGMDGQPQLNAGKLAACLSDGATLVLDCVEELAPRVRKLASSFRDALHAGNYVNLYASWHSQNGLSLHWDSQEIVVLQVAGKKHWQVFEPTRANPLPDDSEAPPRPTAPPVWDGMLEDGDMLYIPRGWWHVAFPVGEPSLHLTVATVPPHGFDLLQWLIGRLRRHEAVRADLPQLDDSRGQKGYLRALRPLLAAALSDDVITQFRHEWEGDLRPLPHIRLPEMPYARAKMLDDGDRIRLSAAHHLHFVHNGASMEFKAHGVLWGGLAPDLVPALEILGDTHAVRFTDLCARLKDGSAQVRLRETLAALARAGVIQIETP
jgi:ribosomal protein L16 Arg81 hydroxylase